MTIEQMIEFITIDTEAKRIANIRRSALGKHIPTRMLLALQAEEEACIILREVQKLYEKTKEEDFGKD